MEQVDEVDEVAVIAFVKAYVSNMDSPETKALVSKFVAAYQDAYDENFKEENQGFAMISVCTALAMLLAKTLSEHEDSKVAAIATGAFIRHMTGVIPLADEIVRTGDTEGFGLTEKQKRRIKEIITP